MNNIEEIKQAVIHLPPKDLAAFRRWYHEYEASIWDKSLKRMLNPASWIPATLHCILKR